MFTSKVKSRISHSLPHCTTHTGPTDCGKPHVISSHLISCSLPIHHHQIRYKTKSFHIMSFKFESNSSRYIFYLPSFHVRSNHISHHIISSQIIINNDSINRMSITVFTKIHDSVHTIEQRKLVPGNFCICSCICSF